MPTLNYLRHLANIIDIQRDRPVWEGVGGNSQLNWLTCCKRQKNITLLLQTNMMLYSRYSMDKLYYSKNSIYLLK